MTLPSLLLSTVAFKSDYIVLHSAFWTINIDPPCSRSFISYTSQANVSLDIGAFSMNRQLIARPLSQLKPLFSWALSLWLCTRSIQQLLCSHLEDSISLYKVAIQTQSVAADWSTKTTKKDTTTNKEKKKVLFFWTGNLRFNIFWYAWYISTSIPLPKTGRPEGGGEGGGNSVRHFPCGTVCTTRRSIVFFYIILYIYFFFLLLLLLDWNRMGGSPIWHRQGVDRNVEEKGALSVINRPGLAAYHRTRGRTGKLAGARRCARRCTKGRAPCIVPAAPTGFQERGEL